MRNEPDNPRFDAMIVFLTSVIVLLVTLAMLGIIDMDDTQTNVIETSVINTVYAPVATVTP